MKRDSHERERIVDRARADLAERLGIDHEEIEVHGIEAAEFRDTSLGVPRPGEVYAQVITAGYVVRLGVQGQTFTYHGSRERVVLASEK